jgi:O-antigen/teichoic acid export membrane protein
VVGVAAGSTGGSDSTDSGSGVSGWVYALVGALVVALIAAVVALTRRRKPGPPAPAAVPKSLAERQAILLAEVQRRLSSGWTVVSQTGDTAMLERSGQVIQIAVDEFGTLHEIPTRPSEGR